MIAVPAGGDAISVAALEAWLLQIGCEKISCPTRFACIWRAPNGWSFTAPNPDYIYLVPDRERAKLGGIIRDVMARKKNPRSG